MENLGVTSSSKGRTRGHRFIAIPIAIVGAFLLGEMAVRAYLHFRPLRHRLDERLGWRTTES